MDVSLGQRSGGAAWGSKAETSRLPSEVSTTPGRSSGRAGPQRSAGARRVGRHASGLPILHQPDRVLAAPDRRFRGRSGDARAGSDVEHLALGATAKRASIVAHARRGTAKRIADRRGHARSEDGHGLTGALAASRRRIAHGIARARGIRRSGCGPPRRRRGAADRHKKERGKRGLPAVSRASHRMRCY